ncbi:MAG: dephospho-CoA kinase [Candidatus Melainabacteria bacterium]|nr:MAG: dephospho-CoA kinase [Candidatus Melainabacteria bacterium]
MISIAIVGNIASGKSTVENVLRKKGYKVFDSDIIAHEVLDDLSEKILEAFKDYDISENGRISRQKLGALVFYDKNLKEKLENIVHPEIKDRLKKIFEENKLEKYIFVSIPLLFEVGWRNLFDKILFIYTEDKIRLNRLMQRNNFTKDEALARIKSQLPQEEKVKVSDFIINNNHSIDVLQKYIERFIIQLEDNGET